MALIVRDPPVPPSPVALYGSDSIGFLPAGTGALTTRTVRDALRAIVRSGDYDTSANFNTAQAALTGTVGMKALAVGDGSASAASLTFAGATNTGIYRDSSDLAFARAGVRAAALVSGSNASIDLLIGPTATIGDYGLYNGIRIDGVNGGYVDLTQGGVRRLTLYSASGGGGNVSTPDNSTFTFGVGNPGNWQVSSAGHIAPSATNSYDLGTSSLKVRTGTFGTSVVTPLLDSTGAIKAFSGTAIPAGGTAGSGLLVSSTANFGVFFGSGAPSLSAAKGSLYLRSDGSSTSTRAYINTDGGTTWTNVTTAA